MTRFLIACLLAFSTATVSYGQMTADPDGGVVYTQDRVVKLPQDQEKMYLTLFGDRSDPRFDEISNWFNTNKNLAGVKNQTHFQVIYTDSTMFKQRYAKTVPATPCIRLQEANGHTVYQVSGKNIPMSADAVLNGVKTKTERIFNRRSYPDGNCPWSQPAPQPAPAPLDDPAPQPLEPVIQVDVVPQPDTTDGYPWGLLALSIGAGLVGGGGVATAKKVKEKYTEVQ